MSFSDSINPDSGSDQMSIAVSLTLTQDTRSGFLRRIWDIFNQKLVVGFTPVFFASVMGTGISANILYNFPFPAKWLQICGIIMAVVALSLFLLLFAVFLLALCSDSKLWYKMHRDAVFAPALGCMVMGYITLVNMLHALTQKSWIYAVWVLWWIATAGSVYTLFITFYFCVVSKHRKKANYMESSSISLTFLLPVVTLTVAAASGGIITKNLPHMNMKITTLIVSLIMWSIAVTLAFLIVAVNFWRMFVHKIPSTGQVFSMFLPIGFLGQGGYAILLFGQNCVHLVLENSAKVSHSSYTSFLNETATANNLDMSNFPLILATSILTVASIFSMALMSFGYFFTFLAFAATFSKMPPFAQKPDLEKLYYRKNGNIIQRLFFGTIRFNRGFWSMSFPLGTMSLSNTEMYNLYHGLEAFRYLGAIYAVLVIMVSLGCLSGVLYKIVKLIQQALRLPAHSKDMV